MVLVSGKVFQSVFLTGNFLVDLWQEWTCVLVSRITALPWLEFESEAS